jgi:hypothetical protein
MREHDETRIHLVYSRVLDGNARADKLRQAMNCLRGSERLLLLRMLDAQRREGAQKRPELFAVTD